MFNVRLLVAVVDVVVLVDKHKAMDLLRKDLVEIRHLEVLDLDLSMVKLVLPLLLTLDQVDKVGLPLKLVSF